MFLTVELFLFVQIYFYHNVRCCSEMYDKDVTMLQVCQHYWGQLLPYHLPFSMSCHLALATFACPVIWPPLYILSFGHLGMSCHLVTFVCPVIWPPWHVLSFCHLCISCHLATLACPAIWPPLYILSFGHLGMSCHLVTFVSPVIWPPWHVLSKLFVKHLLIVDIGSF